MDGIVICLGVCILINSAFAANSDIYSGYSVHGVELRDRSDQGVLFSLQTDLNVDLWEHGAPGVRDARIMVSPENRVKVLDILDTNDIKHYVDIPNVDKALHEHEASVSNWQNARYVLPPYETFARHAEIDQYLEQIARDHPDIVTLGSASNSFEGRSIKYLKISTTNFANSTKPIYFMTATLHAREWVVTTTALYAIHRLVEDLAEEDRDVLENVDWIIMPLVNPDGYEFSHTDNRLWRRTRSFNASISETCYGVDPNRNFDVHFNTIGVSSDPCNDIFPGLEAFSEVETRNVRDIIWEHLDRLQIFMDVHSHGNYILFGFDNGTLPNNVLELNHIATAMGAAIDVMKLPQAPYYITGNSNLVLYGTSGAASDYAQVTGVPHAFTPELPGYGYGFVVPPEFIQQINRETWNGIAVSARLSYLYYKLKKNK